MEGDHAQQADSTEEGNIGRASSSVYHAFFRQEWMNQAWDSQNFKFSINPLKGNLELYMLKSAFFLKVILTPQPGCQSYSYFHFKWRGVRCNIVR